LLEKGSWETHDASLVPPPVLAAACKTPKVSMGKVNPVSSGSKSCRALHKHGWKVKQAAAQANTAALTAAMHACKLACTSIN